MWHDTHDSEPVWDDGSVGCARTPPMAIPEAGEQRGGRVAARPTEWPLERNMAVDVYFDAKAPTDTSMGYPAGLYRGVVDEAKAPTATGIQKLKVDFPGDLTMADVSLKRDQLYEPGQQPKDPTVADGEIAVRVRAEDLPQSKSVSRPYGLTEEQQRAIKQAYYTDFHYSGSRRLWDVLKDRARADRRRITEESDRRQKEGETKARKLAF